MQIRLKSNTTSGPQMCVILKVIQEKYMKKQCCVTGSVPIQEVCGSGFVIRIRIRIRNPNTDPDPHTCKYSIK